MDLAHAFLTCHSRESGNPLGICESTWIPAFAGMTIGDERRNFYVIA